MSRAGGSAILLCEVIEGTQPELDGFASLYFLLSRKINQGTSSLKPSTQYSKTAGLNVQGRRRCLTTLLKRQPYALLTFTNFHS